ncbi:SPRY domain-containing protein 3, variant 2 [Chamberlinius hualienensis]
MSLGNHFSKVLSSFGYMDGVFTEKINAENNPLAWVKMWKQKRDSANDKPRHERITMDGDLLGYVSDNGDRVGVYVAAQPLSPDHNYFEIEIVDTGVCGGITLGLVPQKYPLDKPPGWFDDSIGFHVEDGHLYKGRPKGSNFIAKCEIGDRIGCGIHFNKITSQDQDSDKPLVPVFFTKNSKEVSSFAMKWNGDALYPAVGMSSVGEEIRITKNTKWVHDDDSLMSVDGQEEDWKRLHDIRLNEQILEYVGRGKNIIDVGLAQAKHPLNTTCHYFEIEIIDPGENCFIAIGLTRDKYPNNRHPGWNAGSIAYHADDGKIFVGSGVGERFGPKCHKGDIMGCGIIFPRDYEYDNESDDSEGGSPSSGNLADSYLDRDEDSESAGGSDEDTWANNAPPVDRKRKVQVFFTRNGKFIGSKDVVIPPNGFYPTVGMLSVAEKVRVDLRPLSG